VSVKAGYILGINLWTIISSQKIIGNINHKETETAVELCQAYLSKLYADTLAQMNELIILH
jgi:hypothetical protein